MRVVVTCEHGGNEIPDAYAASFASAQARRALASHRGYDPGALVVARRLAGALDIPFHFATVSRLLVDLNRSTHHPRVWSEFSRRIARAEREAILGEYYRPYRERVISEIAEKSQTGLVLHISVHSFTPVFDKTPRNIDVAWLYDPRRPNEKAISRQWKSTMQPLEGNLRLRFNAPYKGTSDGLTKLLRQQFADERYAGIELEVSQAFARHPKRLERIADILARSLELVCSSPRES